ncbi:MAG: methyltransferase [Sinomicrobium sp.]|nr:methyltransferase [Sinomicrobium sp.]
MKVGTDGVLLGAWVGVEGSKTILDVGSGSGVIAIMLAQRTKKAQVHAVEIDGESCGQARENMERSPWADRLEVFHNSIQDFSAVSDRKYDLIVSNPPFFTGGNLSYNQDRNSVRHTIKMSHHDLLASVQKLLSIDGRFCVILPYIEGLRFCELATTYQLYNSRITEVQPKVDKPVERLLLQFEKTKKSTQIDQLVIQHEKRNDWTADYKALTKAFYLKI